MSIFDKAKKAILKTNCAWSHLKRFVFEYETVAIDSDGTAHRTCRQKTIQSKNLQGAIRKLYLEAEPGFTGLKKIIWEDA